MSSQKPIGREAAFTWLEHLDEWVWVERVTEGDERRAKAILRHYADQTFTFTDAVSFAVMERLNLKVSSSVDRHFLAFQGNFVVLPLSGTAFSAMRDGDARASLDNPMSATILVRRKR